VMNDGKGVRGYRRVAKVLKTNEGPI
jgi:hypothetical protein